MGHNKNRNYGNFFNNKKEETEEVVTEVITTEVENPEIPTLGYLEVTDEVVDSTGNTTEELEGNGEEPKVEETLKKGTVTGCTKLNVRKEAARDADVLAVILSGKEVTVNLVDSTTEFYKVCTPAGIEGYCMKQFITIK